MNKACFILTIALMLIAAVPVHAKPCPAFTSAMSEVEAILDAQTPPATGTPATR